MADGVDAAVDGVETAGLKAPADRLWAQTERQQLPTRHHAMLAESNEGDLTVPSTNVNSPFRSHTDYKCESAFRAPTNVGPTRVCGRIPIATASRLTNVARPH